MKYIIRDHNAEIFAYRNSVIKHIADILNVLMMIPNIFDLITKRKEILRWTGTK